MNYQLDVKKDGSVIATVGQDWTSGSGGGMSGKEKGIASATDWVTFAKLWNANGLPTLSDGVTPDYSLYEDYGWYETEGEPGFYHQTDFFVCADGSHQANSINR